MVFAETETKKLTLREQGKLNKSLRIRTAGEELFKEKQFADVTTKEIAERAGVGEATFFRYATSKIDLLLQIYGDRMEEILAEIKINDQKLAAKKPSDARLYLDRIYAIYRARSKFYKEDPANAALYLREAFQAGSESGSRAVKQGDKCVSLAADILREGQSAGFIRTDVDVSAVAQNCHGIFIHEIDRTAVRGFTTDSISERVEKRLKAQLELLLLN